MCSGVPFPFSLLPGLLNFQCALANTRCTCVVPALWLSNCGPERVNDFSIVKALGVPRQARIQLFCLPVLVFPLLCHLSVVASLGIPRQCSNDRKPTLNGKSPIRVSWRAEPGSSASLCRPADFWCLSWWDHWHGGKPGRVPELQELLTVQALLRI